MRIIVVTIVACFFLFGCTPKTTPPKSTEAEAHSEIVTASVATTDYSWFNKVADYTEIPIYPFTEVKETNILELYDNKKYIKDVYGSLFESADEDSLRETIRSSLQNFDHRFAILYTGELTNLQEILAEAYYSDPMILGTVLYLQYGSQDVPEGIFIHFHVSFTTNKVELATINPKFEEFYAKLDLEGKSVEEKISIIHRAVIENMEYVESDYLYAHSPYGFFVLGEGVCQAYATAMQMLLEKAGIESHYVVGYLVGEEDDLAHAWNLVKTENGWRHIDATNNDMGAQYEQQVNFTFYKLKDEVARQYYVWDESFYPKAE